MKRTRRRLAIEVLESRYVPAGNVFAILATDGTLEITGDQLDNSVVITEDSAGNVSIDGGASTTINGSPGPKVITLPVLDVLVNLEEGSDSVNINRVTFRHVTIDTGLGLGKGRGSDTGDTVAIGLAGLGSLNITTHTGTDFVILESVNVVGDTTINTGQNNDFVIIEGGTFGNLVIDTGSGGTHGPLRTQPGKPSLFEGRDVVRIGVGGNATSITNDVTIDLGQGSGRLDIGILNVGNDAIFDGGLGQHDTLSVDSLTVGGLLDILHFEILA